MKAISNSVANFFIQYFIALFFNLVHTLIHECAIITGSFYTIKSTSILDIHCIWMSYKIYSYYKMSLVLWPFLGEFYYYFNLFLWRILVVSIHRGKNKKLILIMHRCTTSIIWFEYLTSHNTLFNISMFVFFFFNSRLLPFKYFWFI